MAKEVLPGGDEINGMFIPGGTSIGYCAFSIFRDRKIWGEDADVFRPERFLEGEPEKRGIWSRHCSWFLGRGSGSVWGRMWR
jgi:cytochrome P450